MELVRALQPIEPYRPGAAIRLRMPALLDDLEAAIAAIRVGAHTVVARGVAGQTPYNAVVRTPGGDYLALLEAPEEERPDPEEVLSLSRAAAVAGLGARTLQTSIRRGTLAATQPAPRGREGLIRRRGLPRHPVGRRPGPAATPPTR